LPNVDDQKPPGIFPLPYFMRVRRRYQKNIATPVTSNETPTMTGMTIWSVDHFFVSVAKISTSAVGYRHGQNKKEKLDSLCSAAPRSKDESSFTFMYAQFGMSTPFALLCKG
jgi:hypothetical protein